MITVKTPAQGLEQYNVKVTPMLENRIMNDLELGDTTISHPNAYVSAQ